MSQEEGNGGHDDESRDESVHSFKRRPAPLQEESNLFDANDGDQERDHDEAYRGEQEGALHDAYEGDNDDDGDLHVDYEDQGDDSLTRL